MITQDDDASTRYVCMMGQSTAVRLFGKIKDPVGASITIDKKPYTVIGIIKTANSRNSRSFECLVPYSVYLKEKNSVAGTVDMITVKLAGTGYVQQAKIEIGHQLQSLHRGVTDFEIEASADKIKDMEVASAGLKVILWVIAIISLSVGGISIANIMFATIGSRIREIGVRKALGARQTDLFLQFIIEAVVICFVGGLPGFLLGSVVTLMPDGFFPYTPRLETADFLLACGSIACVGLFSGLFPALRAARMQPAEALRH
jgi:putative ABC transport system permease protein